MICNILAIFLSIISRIPCSSSNSSNFSTSSPSQSKVFSHTRFGERARAWKHDDARWPNLVGSLGPDLVRKWRVRLLHNFSLLSRLCPQTLGMFHTIVAYFQGTFWNLAILSSINAAFFQISLPIYFLECLDTLRNYKFCVARSNFPFQMTTNDCSIIRILPGWWQQSILWLRYDYLNMIVDFCYPTVPINYRTLTLVSMKTHFLIAVS